MGSVRAVAVCVVFYAGPRYLVAASQRTVVLQQCSKDTFNCTTGCRGLSSRCGQRGLALRHGSPQKVESVLSEVQDADVDLLDAAVAGGSGPRRTDGWILHGGCSPWARPRACATCVGVRLSSLAMRARVLPPC